MALDHLRVGTDQRQLRRRGVHHRDSGRAGGAGAVGIGHGEGDHVRAERIWTERILCKGDGIAVGIVRPVVDACFSGALIPGGHHHHVLTKRHWVGAGFRTITFAGNAFVVHLQNLTVA